MLSEKIISKNYILFICAESDDIRPGDSFKSVEFIDRSRGFVPEQNDIICCGNISEEEMLFRSGDGRYYFSVKDGWGTKENKLYGIEKGFYIDFYHSTNEKTVLSECKSRIDGCTYNSWMGAMANYMKKDALNKVISVMGKRQ